MVRNDHSSFALLFQRNITHHHNLCSYLVRLIFFKKTVLSILYVFNFSTFIAYAYLRYKLNLVNKLKSYDKSDARKLNINKLPEV